MATPNNDDFNSIQDAPLPLSAKELQAKRFQQRPKNANQKKAPLRLQKSRPPPNAVKLRPKAVETHFVWALVMTILCFFLIGPCWALYQSCRVRRLIERQELDTAARTSHRISTVLIVSTVIGAFVWVGILFCSVGLLLTGKLSENQLI